MSADVILVQPYVGSMDRVRSAPALPLGLLTAATLVEREHKVKLIDQRLDPQWREHLKQELKSQPICVATTSMTGVEIRHALDASSIVKEDSEVPMVWGGVHPSLLPEQTAAHPHVDIVVVGEGEQTFHELVRVLEQEKPLGEIRGLCFKENSHIRRTPERPFLDMNSLPPVPYHLVDVRKYLPLFDGRRTIYMQTSRGCPFNCTYCYNQVFNERKWRSWTPERILEEVQRVGELGAESIYLVDDEFCIDLKRVEAFARGMARESHDIVWQDGGITFDSFKRMSDDYLRTLAKGGCVRLTFGAESGSQRILDMVKITASGKRMQTVDDIVASNRRLSKFDVIAFYSFLAGFPTETDEDLQASIRLIFQLIRDNPNARTSPIYNFTPYPGTDMYHLAIKHGWIPPTRLDGWADYHLSTSNLPYLSPERRRMLENLYIASIFLDNKFKEYSGSAAVKALAALYRPLARFRVKHRFFGLMVERYLRDIVAV
ncbi:MAG: B12-binding domain-containing radical SAM protein [Euryarchaeota archaeon]|nr:B12-binding domain-containing radical SAM protein [Euryarchaeota archaeon]